MEEIPILYIDDHLVAVSKPPGLLVHRGKGFEDRHFLLQLLSRQIDKYLYPVHRLDRAASGVIVFALDKPSAAELKKALESRETRKEYLTLVRGSTPERWEVTHSLKDDNGIKREAHSAFEKIAEMSECTLLRSRIFTGRRHQIRRHLAHCAHQIIGDTSYGKGRINRFFREEYGLPRMFLHAALLEIAHPHSQKCLRIEAPLADDLRRFLARLPDCDDELLARL